MSEFNKTKVNPEYKSSNTSRGAVNPVGGGGAPSRARGVEHPVPEDMALYGDTRHRLHHEPLPRKSGPNFGAESHAGPDPNQLRIDCGEGVDGEL